MMKKGFTLIELLTVIVIISIMAALIVPRLLQQTEQAVASEAMNYLGVIRRAQEANSARTGGGFIAATSGAPGGAPDAGWTLLGLAPLPASAKFSYTCTAVICAATRLNVPAGNSRVNGVITMNIDTGYISACTVPYTTVGTLNTLDGRCV